LNIFNNRFSFSASDKDSAYSEGTLTPNRGRVVCKCARYLLWQCASKAAFNSSQSQTIWLSWRSWV